jgi:enterochelin esterase-like enzyme/sugar lactone lactonase YvrE
MELAVVRGSGVGWLFMKNSSLQCCVCALGILLVSGGVATLSAREVPALSAEAQPQAGVPEGSFKEWKRNDSKIYPQVEHLGALYIPAQYKADQPANAVIFLDGGGYSKKDGGARATVVMDNLIAAGAMPVTVGIFINPGMIPATLPGAASRSVRSYEYDSMGPQFSKFLAEEILPEIRKQVNLRTDPAGWAVCGVSSSAIAAFTAAWERPDVFGNVISHIGSFKNIRGGFAYPAMIRSSREAPKPIRIWMQEGESDLDNMHGHWPLANEDMAAALRWAGYEYHFAMTGGGHSGAAGGALLPAALKWAFQPAAKPAPLDPPKPTSKPARHGDADPKPGVPEGTLREMPVWKSKVFSNTERAWSVYVPAGYKNDGSAGLMVFQDGKGYEDRKGAWGVPTVLDNLIASGEMPMVVAVFISPGNDPSKPLKNVWSASNRSFEYDSLGDRYARFLVDEIIPEVEKQWPVSKDPEMRGIAGTSSGGICAFNVAWERPDQFRRVLSTIGSFVNLRGGNALPYLIRKTERKPLRVFLSDTTGDLDNPFGHWPTANRQMNASLAYMGYDVKFDFVEGYGHNSDRGGEILPDALRWLWRKEPTASYPGKTKDDLGGDMSLNKLLVPGAGWEVVAEGLGFADGLSGDAEGNLYFNDLKLGGYWKMSGEGRKEKLSDSHGSGARLAPDGRVVFCQGHEKRLAAMDLKTGQPEVLAEGVMPNDLVVTAQGWIYFTSTGAGEVVGVEIKSKTKRTMASGIAAPNGIALSPDGGTLSVSEYKGSHVWAWRVNPDGSLDAGMPVMTLRKPIDPAGAFSMKNPPPYLASSSGDGMCSDKEGRWYVTSALGVQVFDSTGRECGLLTPPASGKPLMSAALAGTDRSWLYVSTGDRIFRRKVNAKGW